MNKEFIPYEIALALKELGFNRECFSWYREGILENEVNEIFYFTHSLRGDAFVSAPLYQQAFRWFRENYELHSTLTSISQESWQYHITKPGESLGTLYDEDYYTYEEAELACLIKLIEIIKLKKDE